MKSRNCWSLAGAILLASTTLDVAKATETGNTTVEALESLYEELHEFKDDRKFKQVAYGRCCKYYTWKRRVEALSGKASIQEFMGGFGILPGELVQLGLMYAKGDMEGAQHWEREIAAARSPVSSWETVADTGGDEVTGEWEAKPSVYWFGSHHKIWRQNGLLMMTTTYPDGSSGTGTLEAIAPGDGELSRFRIKDSPHKDSPHQEYYAVLADGALGSYDLHGLIYRAERLEE